jgi:hypothetical protein
MSTTPSRIEASKPASSWRFPGAFLGLVTCFTFLSFAMGAGPGCSGPGKDAAVGPGMEAVDEDEGDYDSAGDELMAEDKLDEIQRFFDRKRTVITRCFTSAIDTGEIPKNASGRLNITVKITPAGKVTNVKITEIQPRSKSFESCVIDTASGWTVTTLSKPFDYSHSYQFGTL